MKNLQNLNLKELTIDEQVNINGGGIRRRFKKHLRKIINIYSGGFIR